MVLLGSDKCGNEIAAQSWKTKASDLIRQVGCKTTRDE